MFNIYIINGIYADMNEVQWQVYILQCGDGTLYCGATNCLQRRIKQHSDGHASKYTRARLPVFLVANSGYMKKGAALALESKIKKLPKADKINVLETIACTN
ncbi:MAG TPA: GIY-YIG nuclease family protein [Nitrospinota bacterium]|nr:GIY-YIG nuclease family protein [Nitrospinota bacterium]